MKISEQFDNNLLISYDFAPNRYFFITDVGKGKCCLNIIYSDNYGERRRNKFYFDSREDARKALVFIKLSS